jgi:2-dehydro-3-deoxygluconokinase
MMAFDCITFGESMVRLAPPGHRRLEQARSLDVQVGGAELNTAVGLARLGRSTSWVSRLTDNPLGRLIANHAREAGVDTSNVLFTSEDRVGLYFLEFGYDLIQVFYHYIAILSFYYLKALHM